MNCKIKLLNYFISILKFSANLFGKSRGPQILAQISEELAPIVAVDANGTSLSFFCPSRLPLWRAQTLMEKEPETIEWINRFNSGEILWDIGANIGLYTIYAASRGIQVLAFEPSPSNYYLLSRNTELNKLDDRIFSYCIALNDTTRLDSFFMANTELGGALNSFGEAVDWKGEVYESKFSQAMLGYSIDDFIDLFDPPFPTHIKIDVDGIEKKIVIGANKTLQDVRLRSVLIELNIDLNETSDVIKIMKNYGLNLDRREHNDIFYSNQMKGIYNHIFVRAN